MGYCQKCGRMGEGTGYCYNCNPGSWHNTQMDLARSLQVASLNWHMQIYHDDGCCGCSVHRRRAVIFLFGLAILVAMPVWLSMGQTTIGIACIPGALFFWICAALCPNGCCGMYSRKKDWGVIRVKDIKYYANTKLGCDKQAVALYDDDSNLLVPNAASPMASKSQPLHPSYSSPNSPSSASAQAEIIQNKEAILQFVRTYNGEMNLTSESLRRWVEDTYDDHYESADWDKVRHKKDIVPLIEFARKNNYKLVNLVFIEVAPHFAVYLYDAVNGNDPQRKPTGVNLYRRFARPGVLGGGKSTLRETK